MNEQRDAHTFQSSRSHRLTPLRLVLIFGDDFLSYLLTIFEFELGFVCNNWVIILILAARRLFCDSARANAITVRVSPRLLILAAYIVVSEFWFCLIVFAFGRSERHLTVVSMSFFLVCIQIRE